MTTSMKYCYFRNLLPELRVLDEMFESLLDKDPETVSLDELKAAHGCFEVLGDLDRVRDVATKIKEAREAQP